MIFIEPNPSSSTPTTPPSSCRQQKSFQGAKIGKQVSKIPPKWGTKELTPGFQSAHLYHFAFSSSQCEVETAEGDVLGRDPFTLNFIL